MPNTISIYYRSPNTGKITSNEVLESEADYWVGQGWTTQVAQEDPTPEPEPDRPKSPNVMGYTFKPRKSDTTIAADTLGEEAPEIETPPITDPDDKTDTTPDATIAGAEETAKGIDDWIAELTPEQTEAGAEAEEIRESMADLVERLGQREADQLTAEEEYDVPDLMRELQQTNARIRTRMAEYDKFMGQQEGRGLIYGDMIGRKANIQRQKASEIGLLQSIALGQQGQVELAKSFADRAVDVKYSVYENNLDIYEAQLAALTPILNEEEKARAAARTEMINQERTRIQDQKNEEKQIQELALTAQQNGADGALVNQIMNAPSIQEAAVIAGELARSGGWKYVKTPAERDDLAAQGYEIVQSGGRTYARKERPEIAERREELELEEEYKDPEYYTDTRELEDGTTVVYDTRTGEIISTLDKTVSGNLVKSASGKSYDMSTYATDEGYASSLQSYIDDVGKLDTIEDIDNYIDGYKPDSELTGQMIANAATDYGVGWEELVGLLRKESILATSNVAKNNNNPGGITWSSTYQASHPNVSKGTARPAAEGGHYVKFDTLQDGVNAVAEQLSRRIVAGGGLGELSALAQEVLKNPGIITTFTPTVQGELREELAKAGHSLGEILDIGDKIDMEKNLRKEYQTNTKETREAVRQIDIMNTSYDAIEDEYKAAETNEEKGSIMNAASQGILVVYQKMLDPTSVVRESEYARSPQGVSLQERIEGKMLQLSEGGAGLTPTGLKPFVELANEYYNNIYRPGLMEQVDLIRKNAEEYKLNLDLILTESVLEMEEKEEAPEQNSTGVPTYDINHNLVGGEISTGLKYEIIE